MTQTVSICFFFLVAILPINILAQPTDDVETDNFREFGKMLGQYRLLQREAAANPNRGAPYWLQGNVQAIQRRRVSLSSDPTEQENVTDEFACLNHTDCWNTRESQQMFDLNQAGHVYYRSKFICV